MKDLDVKFSTHLIWKIDDYKYHFHEAKVGRKKIIFSPPFFTGRQGYKMVASAALYGDGEGESRVVSHYLSFKICFQAIENLSRCLSLS